LQDADAARAHAALADQLGPVMREAGALAMRFFGSPLKSWTKGKNSPVSEADIAVDHLLRERLAALAPDAGWLSEETEDDPARLAAARVWIVDPIDGTRAFLAGRPDWSISVALIAGERPVLAALFVPAADEMFLARAGGGALCNGAPIRARGGDDLAGALVAGPAGYLARLSALAPRITAAPKVFSLALRFARVAQGQLDAAFAASHGHDWDLAAADLLVHEAGGALTTLAGGPVAYNRPEPIHGALVAAERTRHAKLIELLRPHQADFR
jgi:myo-inositol-1(or 4)-monophosphatase